jgi:hypothetical protein
MRGFRSARALGLLLAGSAASLTLASAQPAQASITVKFSEEVEKALRETQQDPERTRRKLERKLNDGLKELGETDADAKALFESGQTIRIVCFGEKEATDAGLTQDSDPLLGGDESGETRGEFDKDGKPKQGGTAVVAIDCEALKRGEGFDKPAAGDKSTMFQVLAHELLHAANEARKHPPDTFDLYEDFVKRFEKAVYDATMKRVNAPPASEPKSPPEPAPPPPPPPTPTPDAPGHGSAIPPSMPGGMLASWGEKWALGVTLGYQLQQVPVVDLGTLVAGAPGEEEAAVESEENLSTVLAGIGMETPFGTIHFEYAGGEASESATEPVGGLPVAFVYYQPNSGGVLGLNTGPNGGEFDLKAELDRFGFRYRLPFTFCDEEDEEGFIESSWVAGPAFAFIRSEVDYRGSAMSINFPGISSTTRQEVDENRYGLGGFAGYRRAFGYSIVGTVEIDVDLYYRDADLRSRQQNFCGEPGCPPAATFTANNRDSDSAFTWGAGFQVGLDYSPIEHSLLGLRLGYRYLGATAQLHNPTSTIDFDRPPHLGKEDVSGFQVGLRYQYAF